MKTFEMPVIEVITFTAESIMAPSSVVLPDGDNRLPWG